MRKKIFQVYFTISILFNLLASCKKEVNEESSVQEESATSVNQSHGHLKQTKTFSSEVVQKWLDLKYHILRTPQEQNTGFVWFPVRFYSALGISLYESVVPGMPAYQSLAGQLSDMPPMPQTSPGMAYHWSASANAALAQMFKNFLPNASAQTKASVDSLENALNIVYAGEVNASTLQRSIQFGKDVANEVFNWSKTDGFYTMTLPYVPPAGPGLWVPTPPGFASAIGPYFGNNRPLMPGVMNENQPPPPIPYSTVSGSPFYNSMREIYDASQLLAANATLKAQANYWRGSMGGSAYILWYAILKKVLAEQGNNVMLDKAALAYCQMAIVQQDATVAMHKAKYYYNEVAPITYIRSVLGFGTWNPEFPTTPLPCYPELHSMQNSVSAAVLTQLFGTNYHFNTDGIHPLGLPGYNFNSFAEAADHGNQSRFLAGVGTQHAILGGVWIANSTFEYMKAHIHFLKDF